MEKTSKSLGVSHLEMIYLQVLAESKYNRLTFKDYRDFRGYLEPLRNVNSRKTLWFWVWNVGSPARYAAASFLEIYPSHRIQRKGGNDRLYGKQDAMKSHVLYVMQNSYMAVRARNSWGNHQVPRTNRLRCWQI